jgi:hypothetical protein
MSGRDVTASSSACDAGECDAGDLVASRLEQDAQRARGELVVFDDQ